MVNNVSLDSDEENDNSKPDVINYQIIHFVKFCQLSDNLSNYSKEILSFYI